MWQCQEEKLSLNTWLQKEREDKCKDWVLQVINRENKKDSGQEKPNLGELMI